MGTNIERLKPFIIKACFELKITLAFRYFIPVGSCAEPVHHSDDDGADTEDADDDHVDELGNEITIEAVVQPGNKTSHC